MLRPLKEGDPAGAELLRVCLFRKLSSYSDFLLGPNEPYLHPENEGGKFLIEAARDLQT